MPDDFSADITTTGALTVGTYGTGLIEESGDADWFAATLFGGTTYRIDLEGAPFSNTNTRLNGVYDSTGTFISGTSREGGGDNLDARGFFTPVTDGTYFLAASTNPTTFYNRGAYRLRITDNWDDYAANTGTTGVLQVSPFTRDSTIVSAIGISDWSGDNDWFAFDVVAGQNYKVNVNGIYDYQTGSIGDGFLFGVYDSTGTYVTNTRDDNSGAGTSGAFSTFTATTTGTYYAGAGLAEGSASNSKYSVLVSVDDYTKGPENAGQLQVNIGGDGKFETFGDRDWFAIDLEAGEDYRVVLGGADYYGYPVQVHSIREADGTRIDGISAVGNYQNRYQASVEFDVPVSGTYYVDVSGTPRRYNTLDYNLKVITGDYTDDTSTEGRVFVDKSVRGNIEFIGDSDWISVDLVAGANYIIDMKGLSSATGSLNNPYIYSLRDANGVHIPGSSDDNGGQGLDAQSTVSVSQTGTYYIDVRAAPQSPSGSSYAVSVTEFFDDFAANASTTGVLSTTVPAIGMIENVRDRDWFGVNLEADTEYRINVASDAGDTSAPFFLGGVKTDTGASTGTLFVAGPDGAGGREYYFTTDTGGAAFVEVRGNPSQGQTNYTLSLAERVEIVGTDGNDFITLGSNTVRDVSGISGGNGTDMVSFDGATQGVVIDLTLDRALSGSTTIPLYSIENATGTSFADTFLGSDRAEYFRGLGGNDLFWGSDGGRDVYIGGAGRDTVSYLGARDGVEASLLRERGSAGFAQDDILRGIENLTGTVHNDQLTGDHSRNFLFGDAGDDLITGNGGDDYILAGLGTDTIIFSKNRDEYTVTQDGIATTVAHTGGAMLDGTDLIGHAEVLRFADGDMIL